MKNLFDLLGDMFEKNFNFPKDGDENWKKTEESVKRGNLLIVKETWVSVDGTQRMERFVSKPIQETVSKKKLEAQLQKAIQEENYEQAAILRDKIKEFS